MINGSIKKKTILLLFLSQCRISRALDYQNSLYSVDGCTVLTPLMKYLGYLYAFHGPMHRRKLSRKRLRKLKECWEESAR